MCSGPTSFNVFAINLIPKHIWQKHLVVHNVLFASVTSSPVHSFWTLGNKNKSVDSFLEDSRWIWIFVLWGSSALLPQLIPLFLDAIDFCALRSQLWNTLVHFVSSPLEVNITKITTAKKTKKKTTKFWEAEGWGKGGWGEGGGGVTVQVWALQEVTLHYDQTYATLSYSLVCSIKAALEFALRLTYHYTTAVCISVSSLCCFQFCLLSPMSSSSHSNCQTGSGRQGAILTVPGGLEYIWGLFIVLGISTPTICVSMGLIQ